MNIELGTRIVAKAIAGLEFKEEEQLPRREGFLPFIKTFKRVVREEITPTAFVVIGQVLRYEGEYHPKKEERGEYGYHLGWIQAYLDDRKGVWLYQCREKLRSEIVLVHPDDIMVAYET